MLFVTRPAMNRLAVWKIGAPSLGKLARESKLGSGEVVLFVLFSLATAISASGKARSPMVYPVSLKSRPYGVRSGYWPPAWQATQFCPVWRLNAGTAFACKPAARIAIPVSAATTVDLMSPPGVGLIHLTVRGPTA